MLDFVKLSVIVLFLVVLGKTPHYISYFSSLLPGFRFMLTSFTAVKLVYEVYEIVYELAG